MKSLYFLRHAKSDWSHNLKDFDRPLNERGEKNAKEIARFLADVIKPEYTFLTGSPARRVKMTYEPLQELLGQPEVRWDPNLYESGLAKYIAAIREFPDTFENALLTGHNPSIADTVEYLIIGNTSGSLIEVPTGCIIRIDLNISRWKSVNANTGVLRWMIPPKALNRFK